MSYHPVPAEFHLFQLIKNGQGSQYCPDNDTIIAIGVKVGHLCWYILLQTCHTGSCWQKFKAISDDDVREKLFCS